MAERDVDAGEVRSRAQQAIIGMLTETIRRDPYPSTTMMDLVESHITVEQLPDYLDVLMEKIDSARFPSMDMIRRVVELT